ncbi:MAG: sulfatase-like hydrolase/transferase [Verrucomicrobiota bacterium]
MEPRTPATSRRNFLKASATALGTALAGCAVARTERTGRIADPGARPNILYVFSDEHRWCSQQHTEMPDVRTPHFARFARQGTSLANCVANNPVCVPYRGILQTGLYPQHSGIVTNSIRMDRDVIGKGRPTLGQIFSQGGYHTGYIGKWHLGDSTCAQAGYDFFHHWKGSDNHWDSQWRDVINDPETYHEDKSYNAVSMTDHALRFVDESPEDKPWLLLLSWNPPHARWDDAPPEDVARYDNGKLSTRPNAPDEMATDPRYIHYHAHITAIDREFGRLMAELEKRSLDENTVVIYTSDHGSGWLSNGFFSKPHPTDEVIRVPFSARWPGKIPDGRELAEPLGTIDIPPTLCGLAGITPPNHYDGTDCSAMLLGRPGSRPDAQLITNPASIRSYVDRYRDIPYAGEGHAHFPCRGIRTDRHTFVVRADGDWLLFDNEADPFQRENLVDDPAHANLKEKLRKRLLALVEASEKSDAYLPDEIRSLPLAEKIEATDEFYVLKWKEPKLREKMDEAMAPLLAKASGPEEKERIRRIAEELYLEKSFRQRFLDYEIDLYSYWWLRNSKEYDRRNAEYKAMLKKQAALLEETVAADA